MIYAVDADAEPPRDPNEYLPGIGVRLQQLDATPFPETIALGDALLRSGRFVLPNPSDAPWIKSDDDYRAWITAWAEGWRGKVRWQEYGNEPDDWDLYFRRLAIASPILRAAGFKVILAPAATAKQNAFFDEVRSRRLWKLVDGVAVHPYAETPDAALDLVRDWRRRIPGRLSIFITEIGWAAGASGHLTVPEDIQAAYLTAAFNLFTRHAEKLGIRLVAWFCRRDPTSGTAGATKWWRTVGTLREDETPRPALAALARFGAAG